MEPYLILFQDEDLLVADKLAPLPVQPDRSNDPDLQSLIRQEALPPGSFLEAAHRIDRRTSGITIFARNHKALQALQAAFREGRVRKTYVACLEREPLPPEGELVHLLEKDGRHNLTRAFPIEPAGDRAEAGRRAGAKAARLAYRLVLRSERYFFVEVDPLTGRHHQIRAQLAAMGWPIRGDLKYGAKRTTASGRIMLHARRVQFAHPRTGKSLEVVAPFPTDERLWQVYSASLGD